MKDKTYATMNVKWRRKEKMKDEREREKDGLIKNPMGITMMMVHPPLLQTSSSAEAAPRAQSLPPRA
jgi:hypothetical protein